MSSRTKAGGGRRQEKEMKEMTTGGERGGEKSESVKTNGKGMRPFAMFAYDSYFWIWFGTPCLAFIFYITALKHIEYRQWIREGKMYVRGLGRGWFMDLPVDLSDDQWRTLRKFIPVLLLGMVVHVLLSLATRKLHPAANKVFYIVTNLGFIYFLHGSGTVWVLLFGSLSYLIGKTFKGSKMNPVCTWTLCILVKVSSDNYHGFRSIWFANYLGPLGSLIDSYPGVYAWQTQFNLTFLRLVSFNMEYYWTCRQARKGSDDQRVQVSPDSEAGVQHSHKAHAEKSEGGGDGKERKREPEPLVGAELFTLSNFVSYVYYLPLYIAGPISPFNRWVVQVVAQHRNMLTPRQWGYEIFKLFVYTVGMEIGLHLWYYASINNNRDWAHSIVVMPGWEAAFGGLFTVQFMYMKFLIIWRFFRTWSLADGIDVPENLSRCVCNNYTFQGFWRQWHGSLNKWIIKYMYIPLGGRSTQVWSIWIIFSFIGLWHDLMWRWLAWAWINCFFFSAEIGVMLLSRHKFFQPMKDSEWWPYVVAFIGVLNIHFLIVANLAIMHGFEGSVHYVKTLFMHEPGQYNGMTIKDILVLWWYLWMGQIVQQGVRLRETRANNGKRF